MCRAPFSCRVRDMRILAGQAKGMEIRAPKGRSTRPTSSRVRGAVFNRLGGSVAGASVLDLFAGTGSLGLEALSRGAASAVFVESSRPAARIIEENLRAMGFTNRGRVIRARVERAARLLHGAEFDLLLLDPPWHQGLVERAMLLLIESVARHGTIVAVHGVREPVPQPPEGWEALDTRSFGDSGVTVYQRAEVSSP